MIEQNSKFYLTKQYVIALSIIAFLSLCAFINMIYLINKQANDGKIINASSHQLMLSQQIALYAIYYQTESLETSIKNMEENHNFLLSLPMSKSIHQIYFEEQTNLNKKVLRYIENAKKFRETTDGKSLTYVLQNAISLLRDLENAAAIYLQEANQRTETLLNFEYIICIVTLITLLFEALFIFRPANITINRRTEELNNEKNYSNSIIESNANAIVAIGGGGVKTFNQTAEKMFGFQKEMIKNTEDLLRVIPQHYKNIHKKGVKNTLSKIMPKIEGKTYNVKLLNSKKEQLSCRISFAKVQKNDIIIINIENISNLILKDALLHKQAKFAALGEMIAIIAHQWKQPLTELGLNNMVIKHKIGRSEISEEINKNEEILKFMSETITNFEDFYKNRENVWFSPKTAVLQSINIVEKVLQLKEIELFTEFDSKTSLFGQQNSLSQVALSIIQNSINKHNQTKNSQKWIKIKARDIDGGILLNIEDNAGGIAEKPIEKIFEPFFTGRKSSSTGLGLYMSRLVIEEKFGGYIKASNTNVGALLSVFLPVIQDNNQVAPHS